MKILNLGAGGVRPPRPWYNLDDLHAQLAPGTPERAQLDSEDNYINHNLLEPLPFLNGSFDAVILSHVVEHFDCQQAAKLLRECHRVLLPQGLVVVSVPDASYFLAVYEEDRNENWPRLFGVTDPKNPIPTFFEAALFFDQHLQLLTKDSLSCLLIRAGFNKNEIWEFSPEDSLTDTIVDHMNRNEFSLVLEARK